MYQSGGVDHHLREASVSKVITIGLDIAKSSFHAHGADERGEAVFSRKLTRGKLLDFFANQPACLVAMEACGGANHWARELMQLGHEVRLIPPAYVKRHKNDAVDAEAICEAVRRPGMRFVAVKTEQQQAAGMVFRTHELLVRQRTQLINALQGYLAEYGWVAPRGKTQIAILADLLDEDEMASSLPEAARAMFRIMTNLLAELDGRQAEAWPHLENGRANYQATACYRRQRAREAAYNTWRAGRLVAGRDAGGQAPQAGLSSARQQDGSHGMSAHDQARGLQSSGRRCGVKLRRKA